MPKPTPSTTHVAPPPPPPAQTPETTEIPLVPVPSVSTCEAPGTYTIPAETITVDKTVTVCGAASTHLPPGTHTYGQVTTDVKGSTTVTCPYADKTNGAEAPVTTHVCHEAGVCTIVPGTTTVVESECDVYYPTTTVFQPGTYTHEAMTVTVTNTIDKTVIYCPFSSSQKPAPPAPKPTKQAPPPPAPKVEKPKAPKVEVQVKVEQPKAAPKPKPAPKPAAPKPKPAIKSSGGGNAAHGTLGPNTSESYAMTYTPYEPSTGNCKSAGEVMQDVQEINNLGITTLRIYSTDCNTIESVGPAVKKLGMKLIVGFFIKGSCSYNSPDVKSQVDKIASWADWEHVELIVVGNESIMSGACSPSELVTLIKTVKSKCPGYNGPWTTAETLNIYERGDVSGALCGAIDVVGANIHAFFNPNTPASKAGDFVAGQIDILEKICPGKTAINLECGWPTGGECNGLACPGKKEQAQALDSIRKKVGNRSVIFSTHNDLWKDQGAFGCEQSWGTLDYFKGNY